MNEGIFVLLNYGKVDITLKSILNKKKINRNKLAKLIGTNYHLINRYYHNNVIRTDLDIIARMCYVLKCDISDILKYKN